MAPTTSATTHDLGRFEVARRFPIPRACRIAAECALGQLLAFDMGGTKAKICLIDRGQPQTARTFTGCRCASP